jgi:hypothetical protein
MLGMQRLALLRPLQLHLLVVAVQGLRVQELEERRRQRWHSLRRQKY